jgi:hypothetical protein
VLIQLIDNYVWGQLALANFGNEIIRIEKSKLLSIERMSIDALTIDSNNFYMERVKSLGNFILHNVII